MIQRFCLLYAGLVTIAPFIWATEVPTVLEPLEVTATREPEPVSRVPASITIINGAELRARGANDLRTALSLTAGVEGTPGGDGGPAGSVPALWGLREVDSFLLVIDGVPVGGAFNPQTTMVDLAGVERIEIVRGAAPVMYGATSFNGVIHVIHYKAGSTYESVKVGGGTRSSYIATGASDLPSIGGYTQSLVATVEQRGFSTDQVEYDRYHILYRGAVGGLHFDVDYNNLPQTPDSGLIRAGRMLRTDLPEDANHNPADAKLDQTRIQVNLGYDTKIAIGTWGTTLSFAHTKDEIIRGFLRNDAPAVDANGNDADGYTQEREFSDLYFDTHVTQDFRNDLTVTYGLDYLYGKGEQEFERFDYFVATDGSFAERSMQGTPDLTEPDGELEDKRNFFGAYMQADWHPWSRVDVIAGLRVNHTEEKQEGEDDSVTPPIPAEEKRTKTRLSGVIGASYRIWERGTDHVTAYADYRNTYKPLALDFGPDAEVEILEPETANSYEIGAKGALNGKLTWDFSLFRLDFRNGLTFDAGNAVNGGETRFQGLELETRYLIVTDLSLAANYAYHDARFVHLTLDDGTTVDGNRFELSPYHLASFGFLYTPAQGFNATLIASYTGPRMLNKRNTVETDGYTAVDASVGYQFGRFMVQLNGYNLSDERPPIAESELSEELAGAPTYYRLSGRAIIGTISMDF